MAHHRMRAVSRCGWTRALGLWLSASVIGIVCAAPAMAESHRDADCRAVNLGALDLTAAPSSSVARHVALSTGDRLTVTLQTLEAADASVVLLTETGGEQVLVSGRDTASATYRAARDGVLTLRFEADASAAAMFTAACRGAAQDARVQRKASKLMAAHPGQLAVPLEAEATQEPDLVTSARRPISIKGVDGVAVDDWQRSEPGASNADVALWMQWRGQRYTAGSDGPLLDPNAAGVELGVDYKVKPAIMVGALTQFQGPSEPVLDAPRSLSDQAWMIGPTAKVELASGFSFDARAGWGGTDQDKVGIVSTDAAAVERKLLNARLANSQTLGALRVTPSVNLNYTEEVHHAANGISQEAATTEVAGGRIDIGPEIAYRIPLNGAAYIEPKAVITRYWDIDNLARLGPETAPHLKAEAGIAIGTGTGAQLQATGGVDSGSVEGTDIWSGRVQLNVPLK